MQTVKTTGPWRSISAIRNCHQGDWFDTDIRAFYKTRYLPIDLLAPIDGRFLITSEVWGEGEEPRYTVWAVTDSADLVPVWKRGHHKLYAEARMAIHNELEFVNGDEIAVDRLGCA